MNKLILAAAMFSLTACGALVDNADAPKGVYLTGKTSAGGESVTIIKTRPANGVVLQGISCQNKIWEGPASEGVAIEVLKREVAQAGYTKVYIITVKTDSASIAKNCWSAVIASGIATG